MSESPEDTRNDSDPVTGMFGGRAKLTPEAAEALLKDLASDEPAVLVRVGVVFVLAAIGSVTTARAGVKLVRAGVRRVRR